MAAPRLQRGDHPFDILIERLDHRRRNLHLVRLSRALVRVSAAQGRTCSMVWAAFGAMSTVANYTKP
ncbi:hypothetical protein [uncultured Sphingomonas sp.]|uniref:hypothetical protein n=1 Tax=uncultured Sphingomonas sp. TaxID=158754 RepID=UPI0025DB146C|nr:hypothetical protein [uncultured Sphingomonas sp.]